MGNVEGTAHNFVGSHSSGEVCRVELRGFSAVVQNGGLLKIFFFEMIFYVTQHFWCKKAKYW